MTIICNLSRKTRYIKFVTYNLNLYSALLDLALRLTTITQGGNVLLIFFLWGKSSIITPLTIMKFIPVIQ